MLVFSPSFAAEELEKIIIDTDAGIDDAVALLAVLKDPYFGPKVEAITCVRGNAELSNVTINVLKTLKIADRLEVPVYAGAVKGIVENPPIGDYFGSDGFGDANYPETPPLSLLQKTHASIYLASIVDKYPGQITVLLLGPMTNLALAIRLNSNFMNQVKRIVALAGTIKAYGYNMPTVEFNVEMDPHAARIVLESASEYGKKITIVTTDACRENAIDKQWRTSKLGSLNTTTIDFLDRIEKAFLVNPNVTIWDTYDVYAAVVMMNSESIRVMGDYYADIETVGSLTKGEMIVDHRRVMKKEANSEVVYSIDKRIVKSICLRNFAV